MARCGRRCRTTWSCPARPELLLLLLLEIVMRTTDGGLLRFYSAFTTFGAPLDVTAASLRVAHFFPVDDATRQRLTDATARLAGCTAAACLPAGPVARPATRPAPPPPARRDNAASR